MTSKSPIKVGIVGFGRIGAEHAVWLVPAHGIRATATADATPARRAMAEARGLHVYDNPQQLLADPNLDVVLISTPTSMHFEHAMTALAAGKHVMVEKPMTLDLPSSQKLLAEAQRRGLVLSVFHNRRWDTDYLTLQAAVAAGKFGRLINVESRLSQWSSCVGPAAKEYRPGWRNEGSFGGGGLYDWGSHFIDQLWRLMLPAKPLRVFAQLRANVWTKDCDDFARVLIDFDNGCTGLMEINTTTRSPLPRWHIDGTEGSAESPFSLAFDTKAWAQFEFVGPDGAKSRLPVVAGGLTETQIWEQFGEAIVNGKPPPVAAESVLPTMALLDAARESSKKGATVEIDSTLFRGPP
jgi:scyllo-inositol 2-dehydrogenase (NADP+)